MFAHSHAVHTPPCTGITTLPAAAEAEPLGSVIMIDAETEARQEDEIVLQILGPQDKRLWEVEAAQSSGLDATDGVFIFCETTAYFAPSYGITKHGGKVGNLLCFSSLFCGLIRSLSCQSVTSQRVNLAHAWCYLCQSLFYGLQQSRHPDFLSLRAYVVHPAVDSPAVRISLSI
jgi:hypothetical protein